MRAIILAAGRGSRLLHLTDDKPKGLVNLSGRPLIEWQIATLKKANIKNVQIVTGYLSEEFDYLDVEKIKNINWAKTNMVGSLACAIEESDESLLVSYSDIIYEPDIIRDLAVHPADIVISYDLDWLALWSKRFDDPLSDAETFIIGQDYLIKEIGNRAAEVQKIQGQYMGLLKFSQQGLQHVKNLLNENKEYRSSLDMTSLLSMLIDRGVKVTGLPTKGRWCEIDDQSDLKVAEGMLQEGLIENPFLQI